MLKQILIFLSILVMTASWAVAQVAPELSSAIEKFWEGRYEHARGDLKAVLNTKTKNADQAYFWLGKIAIEEENWEAADEAFSAGLKRRSKSPWCLAGKAQLKFRAGEVDEGAKMLENAMIFNKGKNLDVELVVAQAYLTAGKAKVKEAKTILYRLKDKAPEDPRAYLLLADYYKAEGVPALAIEEYNKALQINDQFVPAYVALAELYFDQQDYQEGYRNANKAIELDPEFGPAYRIRGELYLLVKEYEKATADYEKYVSLTEGDVKSIIRYASFLFLIGRHDDAIAKMKELEASGTQTTLMLRLMGIAYYKTGHIETAHEYLDKYFEQSKPQYTIADDYETYGDVLRAESESLRAEGDSLGAEDHLKKADEYYEQAIFKKPERIVKYLAIAEDYGKMAKEAPTHEKADLYALEVRYRSKYMEMKGDSELKDFYLLGKAQYYSKQFEAAYSSFTEVVTIKDDYLNGQMWRLRAGDQWEKLDTTSIEWYTIEPASRIVELLGDQSREELSKSERSKLLTSLVILSYYYFDPEGTNANDCAAAQPYVDQILVIDPDNATIKSLAEFCAQQDAAQGG